MNNIKSVDNGSKELKKSVENKEVGLILINHNYTKNWI